MTALRIITHRTKAQSHVFLKHIGLGTKRASHYFVFLKYTQNKKNKRNNVNRQTSTKSYNPHMLRKTLFLVIIKSRKGRKWRPCTFLGFLHPCFLGWRWHSLLGSDIPFPLLSFVGSCHIEKHAGTNKRLVNMTTAVGVVQATAILLGDLIIVVVFSCHDYMYTDHHHDPVFRKPISANRGLNFPNPGLKFNQSLDSVFQTPISANSELIGD